MPWTLTQRGVCSKNVHFMAIKGKHMEHDNDDDDDDDGDVYPWIYLG